MKNSYVPALAVAVALGATVVVPTQAQAQPALPNVAQVQKQIDDAVRNALMSLWAPYDQLVRAFPQLKPLLDPIVTQFLPPRVAPKRPVTNADTLFDAAQKRRGVIADRYPESRTTRAPYGRDAALDRAAFNFINDRANARAIAIEGNSAVYLGNIYVQWNAYTGKSHSYIASNGERRVSRFPLHTLEEYMRAGDYIEGPDGKLDGALPDDSLDARWKRAGTAVIYRDGVIYSAVAYGL